MKESPSAARGLCHWLLSAAFLVLLQSGTCLVAAETFRPRVIFSNDFTPIDVIATSIGKGPADKLSDPDSLQSEIRFLLYTNDFDVEALVQSAGSWANIARKQQVLDVLALYEQVWPNLLAHDARYPSADTLRKRTFEGRDGSWGVSDVTKIVGTGMDSEASDAIIAIVDKPDPRPVWFCCGGGSRELAQAIWKVQSTRSPEQLAAFLAKLRVYLIAKQDGSTQWLLDNFPSLFVILSESNYMGMFWHSWGSPPLMEDSAWVDANLRLNHGPLGAAYPATGADASKPGVVEGDTPAFLHLVSAVRGLNDPELPSQWGWGGRFVRPNPAKAQWFDDPIGGEAIWHWRSDFQADLAMRSSWMVSSATPLLQVSGSKLKDDHANDVRLVGWHQTTGWWYCGYGKFFGAMEFDRCQIYLRRMVDRFTDHSPQYNRPHGWYFNQVRLGSSEDFHGSFIKGTFSLQNFKTWVDRVLVPFVAYAETKGVYVTVFPDVGVPEDSTTPELQAVLLGAWDYVSSHPFLKNRPNLMFELCNEPINAYAGGKWGQSGQVYTDALVAWLQPIVDRIRSNGSNNVIWIPGLGYQGHYAGFARNPVKGGNIGYAVHIYPAYWDSTGSVGDDPKRIRNMWEAEYAPAAAIAPLNITETWWLRRQATDDPYWSLFDGVTGTNDSGFGSALFRIVEESDNVSMCLHHSMTILGKGPTAEVSDPDGVLGWQDPIRDSAVLPYFERQYLWRNLGPRAATPAPTPAVFSNLSVRTQVGSANGTFILGFVLKSGGSASTLPVLLRAAGPSLAAFSVANCVPDPVLTVFTNAGQLDTNDNWGGASGVAAVSAACGAFPFASATSKDAALVKALPEGAYTVHVTSSDGGQGVALGELYDASGGTVNGGPRLVNISARARVTADAGVLIAGFTVSGGSRKTVLIRGTGPTLRSDFGITEALAGVSLRLFSGDIRLQESHAWAKSSNSAEIAAAAQGVGAFAIKPASADAAILCTLNPGSYTAMLSGLDGQPGVGLIEVYEVE